MASFRVDGLDDLIESTSHMSRIPDGVKSNILTAMGEVIRKAQAALADRILSGPYATGGTARALSLSKPKLDGGENRISVTFKGSRQRGGEKKPTRNAVIAFINEFGKRGQPARPFIKQANDQAGDEAVEAGARVFYDWLEKQ